MIKKIALVLAGGLLGFVLLFFFDVLITRICDANPGACPFPRNCDMDCGGDGSILLFGPLLAFLIYSFVAFFLVKKQTSKKNTLTTFGVISVLVVLSVGGGYLHFLIEQSSYLYSIREIQEDSEFSPPVLAKEEIQVFDHKAGLKPYFRMQQWERCALGDGEDKEQFISINCKKDVGWIKKSDVSKLIKLPGRRTSG